MFYSVCEEEEWSPDHYDYARDQHYTEDGEFLSPCVGVELMSRVGKMIFTDVSVVYDDRRVIEFIDEAVKQMKIDRPTSDEIEKFCALVSSTYHESDIDEFNNAMFEFIYDCTYSEWTDMYSGQDLYDDCSLLQPYGWGED